jgi:hypothetical protein
VSVAAFPPVGDTLVVLWRRTNRTVGPDDRPDVLRLTRARDTWRVRIGDLVSQGGLAGIAADCVVGADTSRDGPWPGDPRAAVDSFIAAIEARDWDRAVGFVMWDGLERELAPRIRWARVGPNDSLTAETLLRHTPDMPREVAEWRARSMQGYTGRAALVQRLLDEYAGVDSLEQLERMPTREVAIRWLQAGQPDHLLNRGSMPRRGCVGNLAPDRQPRPRVAAVTTAGPVAYALLQGPASGILPVFLMLWQDGSTWRLRPDDTVRRLTSARIQWVCPQ